MEEDLGEQTKLGMLIYIFLADTFFHKITIDVFTNTAVIDFAPRAYHSIHWNLFILL